MFGPSSRTAGLLCPRLTSGRPSPRLSTRVALRQTARSPRVLRTHLPAYACRIYVAAFHARTGLCIYWPAYPAAPPLSASCSSGQRFACGFLRIPPHDGHPCRSANTPPCRVCRGLSPPSHPTRHHSESNSARFSATRHVWRTKVELHGRLHGRPFFSRPGPQCRR